MPTVSEITEKYGQDSEQRHIDVPKVVQAGVVGKNAVYINGQLYEADVEDSQPGEVIKVANAGRPAAAKYKRLTVGDVHDIAIASKFNEAYVPAVEKLMQSMMPTSSEKKLMQSMMPTSSLQSALSGILATQKIGQSLQSIFRSAFAGFNLPSLNFTEFNSIAKAMGNLGQGTFVDLSKLTVIVKRDFELYREYSEQQWKIREACEILGIDINDPENIDEAYQQMEMEQLLSEAHNAQQVMAALERLNPITRERLLFHFNESRQRKRSAGRQDNDSYDLAFVRWHIKKTHSQAEAFEVYLSENSIACFNESDRAGRWEAFRTSLKNRRRAYEEGDNKLFGRVSKLL